MSHWNHRVVKQILNGEDWYSVREVFYNDDGSIYAYTEEPVDISGESIEALKQYAQWVLNCIDKDILVDGEVKFVDPESRPTLGAGDMGESPALPSESTLEEGSGQEADTTPAPCP
ncbi:MAG: hypothetical protein KKC71_07525 [Chloroflexi bacterium]|nr:hypothetical protein [Chloroflexota bacterium]